MDFEEFPKIPRLRRGCFITEKIDGTNACVAIADDGVTMKFGSRSRWITPEQDNHGFAKWAEANRDELLKLGPGRHFGEWWGQGIQRRYNLDEKRFSLFNVGRWGEGGPDTPPACCHVVPVLYRGEFNSVEVENALNTLRDCGSAAAPGFTNPEGIIVWHAAARSFFKVTLEKDAEHKSEQRGHCARSEG